MKTSLSPAERRDLKARAHGLSPVVMISEAGLSAGVLAEIERGLKIHELIKIRVFSADRDQRDQLLTEICARSEALPVQHIGKILVIYREKPEQAKPRPARKRPAAGKLPAGRTRSSRSSSAWSRTEASGRSGKDRPAAKRPRSASFASTGSRTEASGTRRHTAARAPRNHKRPSRPR